MPLSLANGGLLLLADGGQLLLATDLDEMHIRAPNHRTVNAGTGTTAVAWTVPLDPNALLDFTMSWTDETSLADDTILTAVVELSDQAKAAGLLIHAESHDDSTVTSWLKVDPEFQDSPTWNAPGETHSIKCRITTPKGRTHERTFSFTVRHT